MMRRLRGRTVQNPRQDLSCIYVLGACTFKWFVSSLNYCRNSDIPLADLTY
jgi:hypothetical protein